MRKTKSPFRAPAISSSRAHRDPLAGVEGALEDEAGPAAVGVGAQHARVAPAPRAADQDGAQLRARCGLGS